MHTFHDGTHIFNLPVASSRTHVRKIVKKITAIVYNVDIFICVRKGTDTGTLRMCFQVFCCLFCAETFVAGNNGNIG